MLVMYINYKMNACLAVLLKGVT